MLEKINDFYNLGVEWRKNKKKFDRKMRDRYMEIYYEIDELPCVAIREYFSKRLKAVVYELRLH